jgi:hypothetical protein
MYTGTVIGDLMLLVDRVQRRVEQKIELQRVVEEQELHAIFSMQIPITDSDRAYMGAA